HAFDACLSAHRWLESILLADRNALRGENSYTDEYYDRFYNEAGAILIRQLSDAATDIGSFWLTAWANAGDSWRIKMAPAAVGCGDRHRFLLAHRMGQRGRTGAAALILRMKPPSLSPQIDSLPKAELHLHL